jgi:hypothetical protein
MSCRYANAVAASLRSREKKRTERCHGSIVGDLHLLLPESPPSGLEFFPKRTNGTPVCWSVTDIGSSVWMKSVLCVRTLVVWSLVRRPLFRTLTQCVYLGMDVGLTPWHAREPYTLACTWTLHLGMHVGLTPWHWREPYTLACTWALHLGMHVGLTPFCSLAVTLSAFIRTVSSAMPTKKKDTNGLNRYFGRYRTLCLRIVRDRLKLALRRQKWTLNQYPRW